MKKRKSISLCMIVKNEESVIERCISSIINHVDQIIIVDTGSTDNTMNIIESYSIPLIQHKWSNDFSEARNISLSYATCDYILHLDADEYLINPDVLEDFTGDADYYYVPITNRRSKGTSIIHKNIRLFRNTPEMRYFGVIHEQLSISNTLYGDDAPLQIIHDGYLEEIYKEKNKDARNMKLLLEAVRNDPTSFNYYNLANQYKQKEEINSALECYQKSFEMDSNTNFSSSCLYHLSGCYELLGENKRAIEVLNDGMDLFPDVPELSYKLALMYWKEENYELSERYAIKCLTYKKDSASSIINIEGVTGSLVYELLASIYEKVDLYEIALHYALKCLHVDPNNDVSQIVAINICYYSNHDKLQTFLDDNEVLDSLNKEKILLKLFQVRHPLFIYYINKWSVQISSNIVCIYLFEKGQYDKAKGIWDVADISYIDCRDIISLAWITNDYDWLLKYKDKFKLNESEWLVVECIICKENIGLHEFTDNLKEIIRNLTRDMIKIQKFEVLDYFLSINANDINYIIYNELGISGFEDLALQSITEPSDIEDKFNCYILVSRILTIKGLYEDAIYYLDLAIKLKPSTKLHSKKQIIQKQLI